MSWSASSASQIASVATPGAHQVVAGILLLHQVGPTRHLMMSSSHPFIHPSFHPSFHPSIDPSIHPASPTFIHSSILASMHTLAYASPYVYSDLAYIMLWVAGGNCINNNHYNRCRGTRLVTLPYLTLPYLTLPYLTLPYLTLP